MDHRDLICRNFMWLSEDMYTENGLISVLFKRNVLTVREKERISCMSDIFQKNEQLLGLLSKKSPRDYENFLEALEESSQGHLADKLRNPGGKPTNVISFSDRIRALYSLCIALYNISNSLILI